MIVSLLRASLAKLVSCFKNPMNRYLAANSFHTVSVGGGSIGRMVVALDQDPSATAGGTDFMTLIWRVCCQVSKH